MSIYVDKKTRSWTFDFWVNGIRFKRQCMNADGSPAISRRQAKACEEAARVIARKDTKAALSTREVYTLAQAVAARVEEARHLRNWRDIAPMQAEILEFFGPAAPIDSVANRWMEYRAFCRRQIVKKWRGGPKTADRSNKEELSDLMIELNRPRSPARTNRYLDQLSATLRLAHNTRGPDGQLRLTWMPKIEKLTEAKRDPNPVPLAVLARIESDPATPDHLWQAAALVRLFGLRLSEVFKAKTNWIDWEAEALRLPAAITKANRDEILNANDEALELLSWLAMFAAERKQACESLIVYSAPGLQSDGRPFPPRPIKNARRAWSTVLKRFGMGGRWRFHDLRATYITQVALVASSATTQSLARHKSAATTALYTEVADSAKRAAVAAMRSTSRLPASPLFKGQSPTEKSHLAERTRTDTKAKLRRIK